MRGKQNAVPHQLADGTLPEVDLPVRLLKTGEKGKIIGLRPLSGEAYVQFLAGKARHGWYRYTDLSQ